MVSCKQFAEAVSQPVDNRRLPVDEQVLAHAATCTATECRELWREHLAIEQSIARWKQTVPTVSLVDRVLRELSVGTDSTSAPPRDREVTRLVPRHRVTRWGGVAALAGLLALLIVSIGLWQGSGVNVQDGAIAVGPETTSSPNSGTSSTGDTVTSVAPIAMPNDAMAQAPVGAQYVLAAQSATEFMTDAAFLFVAGKDDNPMNEPNRAEKWVDGVGEKLAPMREDLSRTLTNWLGPTAAM